MTTLRSAVLAAAVAAFPLSLLPAQQTWRQLQNQVGPSVHMQSASSVAGVGDVDQDGFADYVLGAWSDDAGADNAGSYTLYSGQTGDELATDLGSSIGGKLGWRVVALGTHNGDGKRKFAISAPFHSGAAGPFCGQVRIVYWDAGAAQLQTFETFEGSAPGEMIGGGLAALDADNDGDLDLAVGSLGAGTTDGRVDIYAVDSVSIGAPVRVLQGAPGSAELFGFSLAGAGNVQSGNAHELLVGSPLADDGAADSGVAEVWIVSSATPTATAIPNPVAATAGAHFGWSVAGGADVDADGTPDFVVGAPDVSEGQISVNSGAAGFPSIEVVSGETAGDRFGFAVALTGDVNFDGFADYAAGAPRFNGSFGKIYVRSARPAPGEVFSDETPADAVSQFGFSVGNAGDINQDGKEEILVGGPTVSEGRGFSMAYGPPVDPPDPPTLAVAGSFEWETDVTVTAGNLDASPVPGTLYWYVGDQQVPTVSPEGYQLDIGGNLQLVLVEPNPGTGTSELIYHVSDSRAEGSILAFQMVEDRGQGFVRTSPAKGNYVVNPGPMLFLNGIRVDLGTFALPLSSTFQLETRYGQPVSPVFFYWGNSGVANPPTVQAPNANPNDPFFLSLINPQLYGFVLSDANGVATFPPQTPMPTWNTGIIRFEAFDWDIFPVNRALTPAARGGFQ